MLFVWVAVVTFGLQFASAQKKEVVWSADEKPLADQIHGLRGLADDVRAGTTKDLALKIRKLPATENKLRLAVSLAGLSTEGDFGHNTLQEVATTLAETLRDRPVPWAEPKNPDAASKATREPARPYIELATLVRYEHVEVSHDLNNDEQFRTAMTRLEADDRKREHPEFTLKDLSGKLDVRGTARQSRVGEFLGDLVSALPQGDAGAGNALRALQFEGAGGAGHLR
jgi:hypothetical protein